jgi:hypothetical protein
MSIDQFLLSADTTDLNYPEIRPTLDLNFARVKALDPRIDFTRASGGSYVGADGLIKYAGVNEARFDHDPETGESLGLLIEEARSNRFNESETFDLWSLTNVSISADVAVAPDGNKTADKQIATDTGSTNVRYTFRSRGVVAGVRYTWSTFAKAGEWRFLNLFATATGFSVQQRARFDLELGTVVGQSGIASAQIQAFPNGWYRCTLITRVAEANGTPAWRNYMDNDASSNPTALTNSVTGDGISGIFLWGAQVEEGDFPTSYIPTQESNRTRAADNASITGKNFSSFYRQDEGTVFVDFRLNTNGTARVFNIDDGTGNNRISGLGGSTFYQTFFLPGNRGPTITLPSSVRYKVMSAHKDYDVTNYLNENYFNSTTGRDIIIPKNLNTFRIGNWQNNTLQGTTISRLTYFPKRLPNAQLQALTR